MKTYAFILFFSIVFLFYAAINYYILSGVNRLVPVWKPYTLYVLLGLALLFPAGRFLEKAAPSSPLAWWLVFTGALYLAVMVYAFLFTLAGDLLRLGNQLIPGLRYNPDLEVRLWIFRSLALFIFAIVGLGYYNAQRPQLRLINIQLNVSKPVRLLFMSDIHLGTLSNEDHLRRIRNLAKEARPDLIVFGGDTFDEDPGPVIRNGTGKELLSMKAPLGVYAVTGNHEYIGGAEKAIDYMQKLGIRVLRDEAVQIDSLFWLTGREDREISRFSGAQRKAADELPGFENSKLPVILVDHQPNDYAAMEKKGVALMLSGHTHYGQLWPLNYITHMVFENSFGLQIWNDTFFYVSGGAGTWGPPVRTSSRPEIVLLNITPSGSPR